jgi:activator of 2-hydroxyglutaryl-CoA dehydratase
MTIVPQVIGVDIGSVAAKGVLFDGSIAASTLIPTGWDMKETARSLLSSLVGKEEDPIPPLVATGYGRKSVDGAHRTITEITCHAKGVRFLHGEARTILDIGGQDSKVIGLDSRGKWLISP